MRSLVIQTAFLGDVVLATPVIEKLHRCHPEGKIDVLVRKGNEQLLQGHPYINELLVWDKKQDKWKNVFRIIKAIRRNKYDHVINLQRFFTSGLITILSGASQTIGFDKNPMSMFFTKRIIHKIAAPGEPIMHEVERDLLCIRHLTDDSPAAPRLYPSTDDERQVNGLKAQPYITISPASVWFTKQYPPEKWVDLIRSLDDKYMVYLLGGPGDAALCKGIMATCGKQRIRSLCGELGLLASAALMKDAVMNYVNDSAPLHMASAMDAPVTAVFCSTVPRFGFGPSGSKGRVVETPLDLTCRPCGLHGHQQCPEGHFKCAHSIETSELTQGL